VDMPHSWNLGDAREDVDIVSFGNQSPMTAGSSKQFGRIHWTPHYRGEPRDPSPSQTTNNLGSTRS